MTWAMFGLAVAAALAMFAQDIIGVIQVQAEARNRGRLAGLCDVVGWLLAISTLTISVSALQGHNLANKITVIILVSIANYFGSDYGVAIGRRFVKVNDSTPTPPRFHRPIWPKIGKRKGK